MVSCNSGFYRGDLDRVAQTAGTAVSTLLKIKVDTDICGYQPERFVADGHETAALTIQSSQAPPPTITFEGRSSAAVVDNIEHAGDRGERGFDRESYPGPIAIRIDSPGYRPAAAQLTTVLDEHDSAGDGTPDFLRLDDPRTRRPFGTGLSGSPRPGILCEALRAHNNEWIETIGLPEYPALESVRSINIRLRRSPPRCSACGPGRSGQAICTTELFLQFADAQTLWHFNAHLVSRDVLRALPGDLLFFPRQSSPVTFSRDDLRGRKQGNSLSKKPDGHRYLLYHTTWAQVASGALAITFSYRGGKVHQSEL